MEKEKIIYLERLIAFVENKNIKLKEYYEDKEIENFISLKKTILQVQKKISGELE